MAISLAILMPGASIHLTAWAAEDSVNAAALATGSAIAADGLSNHAVAANPGVIGLHERYDFEGFFHYGPSQGLHWGASAVDSKTTDAVAFGVVYSGDTAQPSPSVPDLPGWIAVDEEIENKKRYHDITPGIAIPLANRRLSIGMNGTIAIYNHDLGGKGVSGNMDGGLGVKPVDWLTVAVAARNFLPLDYERPFGIRSGVRVDSPRIGALEADFDWIDGPPKKTGIEVGAGGELVASTIRLRAGGRYSQVEASTITWGLGVSEGGAELGYGMSIPIGTGDSLGGMINGFSLQFSAPDMRID